MLWQDEEFKAKKLQRYNADLKEQELRMKLLEEQIRESQKRQILLDHQVEESRCRIKHLQKKLTETAFDFMEDI
jgi:hypothetical protein